MAWTGIHRRDYALCGRLYSSDLNDQEDALVQPLPLVGGRFLPSDF